MIHNPRPDKYVMSENEIIYFRIVSKSTLVFFRLCFHRFAIASFLLFPPSIYQEWDEWHLSKEKKVVEAQIKKRERTLVTDFILNVEMKNCFQIKSLW